MPSRVRSRKPGMSRTGARQSEHSSEAVAGVLGGSARQGGHVTEMQRRRLVLALIEVVAEEGLESGSVGRICKRAGVSRRTFYENFDDREGCLLAGFDHAIGTLAESVLTAYEHEHMWSARIRAALTSLLEAFDMQPGHARLCIVESPRAGPDVVERRKRTLDTLTTAIDRGRTESKQGATLPPLTAQGVVGGALSVIHARLLEEGGRPLVELVNPLMGMIVHPFIGPAAATRELNRPVPHTRTTATSIAKDPFKGLPIRFTYRTALVLSTIADSPRASNRFIADASGIADEGQMSRLLARLKRADLIENQGDGQPKGEPNSWVLTQRGHAVHSALGGDRRSG